MEHNAPHSNEDIRGQLTDLQKRLFGKIDKKFSERRGSNASVKSADENTVETSSTSNDKDVENPKKKPLLSKPLFLNPSWGPDTKGNDVNFVVGLSENLLTECRRLTAENQKYKLKLKNNLQEVQVLNNSIKVLQGGRESLINKENQLKEQIWELESKVSTLNEQLAQEAVAKEKLQRQNQEVMNRMLSFESEIVLVKDRNEELLKDKQIVDSSHKQRAQELSSKVQELNDENDQLHKELSDAKERSANAKYHEPSGAKTAMLYDTSSEGNLDAGNIDYHNMTNQSNETKDRSFDTSGSPHIETPGAMPKLKNSGLKSDIAETEGNYTPRKERQAETSPISKKQKRQSVAFSPSKRNSRLLIVNQDSEVAADRDSDQERSEEISFSSPRRQTHVVPECMKREIYESEDESFLSGTYSQALLSNELAGNGKENVENRTRSILEDPHIHDSGENLTKYTQEDIVNYVHDKGLVVLTQHEYEDLEDENARIASLKERGYKVLSSEEYNKTQDDKEKTKSLEDKGFLVISQADYTKLEDENNKISSLTERGYKVLSSEEYNKTQDDKEKTKSLEDKGFLVMSQAEIDKITAVNEQVSNLEKRGLLVVDSDQCNSLRESGKNKNFKKNGLVVISTPDYETLKKIERQHDKPTREYIVQKAAAFGLVAIARDRIDTLSKIADKFGNPSKDYLASNCSKFGLCVLPQKDYDTMKSISEKYDSPSKDYLESKSQNYSMELIPKRELEELRNFFDDIPLSRIQEDAIRKGYHVLHGNEVLNLHNPDKETVEKHAKKFGNVLITEEDHRLLKALAFEPSLEHIQEFLKSKEKTIISDDDLLSLENQKNALDKSINEPSISYIEEKASEKGLITFPQGEHRRLQELAHSPPFEHLLEQAGLMGMTLVSREAFEQSQKLANEPSMQHLSAKAKPLNATLLSNEEYRTIVNPSLEVLSEKASLSGFKMVPDYEYKQLQETFRHPSKEFLLERALESGLTMLQEKELDTMKETINSPSIEFVCEKASKFNSVVVDEKILDNLKKSLENPKYALERAQQWGYKMLPEREYSELKRLIDEPTLSELKQKAERLQCYIIENGDYEAMVKELREPSLGTLKSHTARYGYSLVSTEDYEKLKQLAGSPSRDYLERHAKSAGLIIVPSEEYKGLNERVNDNSLARLQELSSSTSYTIVSGEEWQDLHNKIQEPSSDYLRDRAAEKGYGLIHVGELLCLREEVRNPSLDKLINSAKGKEHEVIPQAELVAIREELANPSYAYLQKHSEKMGQHILSAEEYTNLKTSLNDPSVDYLKEKARKYESVVLTDKEYFELRNPSSTLLRESASRLGLTCLGQDEYKALREQISNPAFDYLLEHLGEKGFLTLKKEELKSLREEVTSPSVTRVQVIADSMGCHLIPQEEYKKMNKLIENPDISHLNDVASLLSFSLIPKGDYENMKGLVESPSIQFILTAAESLNYKTVDFSEYEQLSKLARRSLKEAAIESGFELIDAGKYQELLTTVYNPSMETIVSNARKYDQIVIRTGELEDLKECVQHPTLEYLTQKCDELGHVVLGKQDHEYLKSGNERGLSHQKDKENLKESIKNPTLEYLTKKCKELEYLVIGKEAYQELNSSNERELAYQKEMEKLKEGIENPAFEYLTQKCDALEHLVIGKEAYQELISDNERGLLAHKEELEALKGSVQNPTLEYLTQKCDALEHLVIGKETYEQLNSGNERGLAYQKEVESLKERIENPAFEYLTQKCKELEYLLIGIETYEQLKSGNERRLAHKEELENLKKSVQNPPLEYLTQKCDALERLVIGKEAYQELTSDNERGMSHKEELETLKESIQNPTLEFLAQKCEALEHQVVRQETYQKLKSDSETGLTHQKEKENLRESVESPTLEYLVQKCEALEYVVIGKKVYEQLKSASEKGVTHKEELESLKKSVQTPSLEFLAEKCNELGHLVIGKEAYQELKSGNKSELAHKEELGNLKEGIDNPALEYLTQKCDALEHVIIGRDSYRELKSLESVIHQKPLETSRVLKSNVGVDTGEDSLTAGQSLPSEDNESADSPFTELKEKCEQLGFMLLRKEDYQRFKVFEDTENGSDNASREIFEDCFDAALSVPAEDRYLPFTSNNETELLRGKKSSLPIPNKSIEDKADIKKNTPSPNFELPKVDYLESPYSSPMKTLVSVEKRGLRVLDENESNKLLLSKEKPNLDRKQLAAEALKLDLLCIPKAAYVPTNLYRTPNPNKVTVVPTSYYEKLSKVMQLNVEKISDEKFIHYAKERGLTFVTEAPKDVHPDSNYGISPVSSVHSNGSSISGVDSINTVASHGGFSIGTKVSFTNSSMIPAITQVVIGEYLFKYYRRLGALNPLSSHRHERYFWVHPYSLTLYWSSANPVLSNPSQLKTKAAAIVGVESVIDNNPLPTGLYHKSIIVYSQRRSLKITCATRQRHNVWYNALRYLINRRIDDLVVDVDDSAGGHDTKNVSSKRETLELGERNYLPRRLNTNRTTAIPRAQSQSKMRMTLRQ